MNTYLHRLNKEAADILINGGVGVLPTDTIYGIVGSAMNAETVRRIYTLRRRSPLKPMIVLIGSLDDLRLFNIKTSAATLKILRKLWPGKVSIILPCKSKKFSYLHRGTKSLAFRLPAKKNLQDFLNKTGPLIAPSANWESKPPAKTIREAKKYFGPVRGRSALRALAASDGIDFYIDVGRMDSPPSTLVRIQRGKSIVLRNGAAKL